MNLASVQVMDPSLRGKIPLQFTLEFLIFIQLYRIECYD